MTVSAVARLMPRPPARVDSRNAKSVDPGALKCSMACSKWRLHFITDVKLAVQYPGGIVAKAIMMCLHHNTESCRHWQRDLQARARQNRKASAQTSFGQLFRFFPFRRTKCEGLQRKSVK